MSADRPAGAAGEDSDEYSEATDDQNLAVRSGL